MPLPTYHVNRDITASLPPQDRSQILTEILRSHEDHENLRQQIQQIDGDKVQRVAILSFRGLQLYRIAKLQAELIRKQNGVMNPDEKTSQIELDTKEGREEGKEVDELLQRYADAVRNYETLSQAIDFDEDVSYEFLGGMKEFKVIKRTNDVNWGIPLWLARRVAQSTVVKYPIGPLGFRELDRGRLSQRKILKRIQSRLHMGLFGGTALIAPVVYMTLNPTLTGDLVAASLSTTIFSIVVVIFATDASGKDVLACTAAYAAVMVVFIGTSLQTFV
ncbi:hypothetical protein K445DRAFT_19047 [Daldinia sp. EC12]|nr:hypothetical protein F4774DRAFT_390436 [Daldinia eschscholtzii]OTB19440.1 hypothetical protein K445DRAFT_19047 [Daldinia sp. EC12]